MFARVCAPLCVLCLCAGCLPGLPDGAERYVNLPQDWLGISQFLRCQGPDPAVSLRFELIEREGPTRGRVRITATLENRGNIAWASDENQQLAMLFEDNVMLESRNFQMLALDERIEIVHEVDWWTGNEFKPAAYRIVLSYDPDIYIDQNPLNDDCSSTNNDLERPTSEIDALLE